MFAINGIEAMIFPCCKKWTLTTISHHTSNYFKMEQKPKCEGNQTSRRQQDIFTGKCFLNNHKTIHYKRDCILQ